MLRLDGVVLLARTLAHGSTPRAGPAWMPGPTASLWGAWRLPRRAGRGAERVEDTATTVSDPRVEAAATGGGAAWRGRTARPKGWGRRPQLCGTRWRGHPGSWISSSCGPPL